MVIMSPEVSGIFESPGAGLDNVVFLPYQPRESMRDSYATADVFIVSLKPGLAGYIVPSKLYGILAAGKPYVAAVEEETEVAAITKQHQCGLLSRPGDALDLADKITILYQDRDLRRRLGENARKAGLEFDRRTQVRAYFRLFEEAVISSKVVEIKAELEKLREQVQNVE